MTDQISLFLKKRQKIIGSIASTVSVIMYVAIIEVLISNLSGQSDIVIQPLSTAFNGLLWAAYGWAGRDWFIFLPNVLGFILGAITAISGLI